MSDYKPEIIYDPIIWNGNPGTVSGSTSFGYFDDDPLFQRDAVNFAKWASRRLGYPMIDVEADSGSFYTSFEDAIMEYSSQVHEFTIRENMMSLIGTPNSKTDPEYIDYTNRPAPANLQRVLTISEQYGSEAEVGGAVTWRKYPVPLVKGVQEYDLNSIIGSDPSGSNGNAIEIKRIYHYEPIAYGYGLGGTMTGAGLTPAAGQSVLQEFGWEGMMYGGVATGLSYTVMPVYEDLLRMQAVELNNQIRRSGYGFEVRNNRITILPIPKENGTLWVDYIYKMDRLDGSPNFLSGSGYYGSGSSQSSVTSNMGNAPYQYMVYSTINDPGRRWILKYALSNIKSIVGEARSKYQTIPIPNGEVSLNGDSMKQEAIAEKEQLVTQLRESLERTSPQNQWQIQADSADAERRVLSHIPVGIYIG